MLSSLILRWTWEFLKHELYISSIKNIWYVSVIYLILFLHVFNIYLPTFQVNKIKKIHVNYVFRFIFPEKEPHILIIEVLCYHCESHSLMKKYIISQVRFDVKVSLKYSHWSIFSLKLSIYGMCSNACWNKRKSGLPRSCLFTTHCQKAAWHINTKIARTEACREMDTCLSIKFTHTQNPPFPFLLPYGDS